MPWIKRWRYEIWDKPAKEGIWRIKGEPPKYLARVRAVDPRTGKMREVKGTCESVAAAQAWQAAKRLEIQHPSQAPTQLAKTRFYDYTVSLLEHKQSIGKLKSAATIYEWKVVLDNHFTDLHDLYMSAVTRPMLKDWVTKQGARVQGEGYSPRTVNGWIKKLVCVMGAWADEHDCKSPAKGLPLLDESTHPTYTKEQPNSLTREERERFFAALFRTFPTRFAMIVMGFTYGMRPSSLRPLRWQGPQADIKWPDCRCQAACACTGILLIRRSHSRGQKVMNTTKTKLCLELPIPPDTLAVLRWHIERLTPRQTASELLFPGKTGRLLSTTSLNAAFSRAVQEAGITKLLTPRCMRRTYQDIAREAKVEGIIARSISGHVSEQMQDHYSTVSANEKYAGLAKVIELAGYRQLVNPPNAGNPKKRSHE